MASKLQPEFVFVVVTSQSVPSSAPVEDPLDWIEHDDPVWSVIRFDACKLTPSMISISPPSGQFGPTVQLCESASVIPFTASGGGILDSQRRPHATDAAWHVKKINNHQAQVVRLFAAQAHALTSSLGCHLTMVDPDVDGTVLEVD